MLLIAAVVLGIVASRIAAPSQGRFKPRVPFRSARDLADEIALDRVWRPRL